MEKRKFVKLRDITPGMLLGETVVDGQGRSMIEKGEVLDDFQIRYLRTSRVPGIFVYQEISEQDIPIPEGTKMVVRRERRPDRKLVQYSEDIKSLIRSGVEEMFDNPSTDMMSGIAVGLAKDMVENVVSSHAAALDISQVKISDEYNLKHSADVATIALSIGRSLGLRSTELEELCIAGLLHDIGKSHIPQNLLNKPSKLTKEEFSVIKSHSLYGYLILKSKNCFSKRILEAVIQHHERINGSGYPRGLRGNEINLFARIIAVADIFDALVSKRPYKDPYTVHEAIEMMLGMYEDLDLDILKAFLNTIVLYPVDTIVKLSNGKYAKVVENYPLYPLRPKVVRVDNGQVLDLSNDTRATNIVIW